MKRILFIIIIIIAQLGNGRNTASSRGRRRRIFYAAVGIYIYTCKKYNSFDDVVRARFGWQQNAQEIEQYVVQDGYIYRSCQDKPVGYKN